MENDASWESFPVNYFDVGLVENELLSKDINGGKCDMMVSLDAVLPDDVLEKILSLLPIASILRARSVCKRWHSVVHSRSYSWMNRLPQKPWYFMFTRANSPTGYAFDPNLRKWYNFDLPCIERSNWLISSSHGLVCFMDNDNRSRIFVCNPITRYWTRIPEPPGVYLPDYSALAMSVDQCARSYTIVVAKSKLLPSDLLQSELSIHIYESETGLWVTPFMEILVGWRGGDEGVICNGVFYCLIHRTGVLGNADIRHGLLMYDLSARSSNTSIMRMSIPVPLQITCGRLMNLKDKLVLVGGIAKHDRPDIIKGICIWELHRNEWREIARMPHRLFQGFGEFDEVFASSGADDLVFIQSFGGTALLTFDMKQRSWKWSVKCPVTKRFPLQLFTGFCFEPRLEAAH
ncbi:F-box/kelch-repeat protein At3g61590-like isoform X1 [Dioscorea cayenensis subsp. rotundata]|uniref:F-box/kelch-repeat protein At3g61590-like isoform X1 n=2 Tax=Dioscorea cayennensis subsp. rotundata TaxID=55577 RepID=A0AB40AKU1_DIOCR|nr:F-box/kelch-repeat protein At3g61590-like isoform X1 [Dioscorea cayenensis subsp. rotundata]